MYLAKKGNLIHSTAVIGENVKLGTGNIIQPFAVIGSPGFLRDIDIDDFNGEIIIGDNNRIGAHCAIMHAANKDEPTVLGSNNLIMNFVNIGHGVTIGDNNEIGAGSIVAGNAIIEDSCKIKIGVLVRNNIKIGARSFVAMGSVVVSNLKGDDNYLGIPAKSRG